jgi:GDSL-like Lipase/Acylhydrolase family
MATGASKPTRKRRVLPRVALLLVTTLAALAIAEVCCRLIFGSPRIRWSIAAGLKKNRPPPDPILGTRMPPNARGHDARGWRNAAVPDRADLVAIGDSHTWGSNARIDEAWPQVLARQLGRPVYNLALGGYGPIQYEALANEAMGLRPTALVVALYLGNDLWDAYARVYSNERYREQRNAAAGGDDLTNDTVRPRVRTVERRRRSHERPAGVAWLQRRVALVRLATQAGVVEDHGYEVELAGDRAWLAACPEDGFVLESGSTGTCLTTAYRLLALDLGEPRIAEGLRLTRDSLARLDSRCRGAGVRLLVVSFPTKESAYVPVVRASRPKPDPGYERLVAAESRVSNDLASFCRDRGIAFHDLLPALRKGLQDGVQLYPATADGHPLPAGYAVYASSIAEEIRRLGW